MHKIWPDDKLTQIGIVTISGLLLLRLFLVVASPLELYADEAQYWRWGTSLDWGYYSKPPMVAWVIRFSTELFGVSEWGVRLLAPALHTIAVSFLFLLARQMFGNHAGLLTVFAYLLMPGIILSSTIISTDGVLFPFWCLALFLFWQLREAKLGWGGAALLGAAIGCGFLSKYAMLYFAIGIALTMLLDAPTRKAMLSPKGAVIAALALAVLSPHLFWNAANEFQTVGHTVDNANLEGKLFNLENLPKFLLDQMGVFGPVSFLALIIGLAFARAKNNQDVASKETWLACFIVPVIVIIAFQAVLSRAHANWAATAYPAASILVASIFLRLNTTRKTWLIIAGIVGLLIQIVPEFNTSIRLGIGVAVAAFLLAMGAMFHWRAVGLFWSGISIHIIIALVFGTVSMGPPSWSAAIGADNTFKRTRGWQDLADQLVREAERTQPTVILVDERELWHGLDFYTRDRLPAPLILWRYNAGAENFAEQVPLTPEMASKVLVASYRSNLRPRIKADFDAFQPDGVIGVDLGHRGNGCPLTRELRLYIADGFQPLERNAAWIARFKTEDENGKLIDTHIDRLPRCPPLP